MARSFPTFRVACATATTLWVALLAGCGQKGSGEEGTTLTVYAAASLTRTFEAIGAEFEEQHDGVRVELSFGGSSDLASQIQEGAPADVFASADTANMDKLTADDLTARDPQGFATNTLAIAVPPGNPGSVTSFGDLTKDGLQVVVCAPQVPCGAAVVEVEAAAGVDLEPVSEEQSVTDVLAKVRSGEADAGLVYVTDVRAAGDEVEGVPVPEAAEAVNTYPIAALADAVEPDLAQSFVDLVLSEAGQQILRDAGFGPVKGGSG